MMKTIVVKSTLFAFVFATLQIFISFNALAEDALTIPSEVLDSLGLTQSGNDFFDAQGNKLEPEELTKSNTGDTYSFRSARPLREDAAEGGTEGVSGCNYLWTTVTKFVENWQGPELVVTFQQVVNTYWGTFTYNCNIPFIADWIYFYSLEYPRATFGVLTDLGYNTSQVSDLNQYNNTGGVRGCGISSQTWVGYGGQQFYYFNGTGCP